MLADIVKYPFKVVSFARKMRAAHALYGKPYPDMLRRFMHLCDQELFSPREVFLWDLLGPKYADSELQSALSKAACVALQQRLNPASAAALTEDKSIFYQYCVANGLPTPRLLAVIGPQLGWTADRRVLASDDDWIRFFTELQVSTIVVKPVLGVYARSVRLLRREGVSWIDARGRRLSPEELTRDLRQDKDYNSFVVQERAYPHPRLVELSGTDYMQTLRVVTIVSPREGARVVFPLVKVIAGSSAVDNFSYGATGNFLAPINLTTGRIECARAARPGGVGTEVVERHPVTGVAFAGYEVPLWHEACDLARRAAMSFLPLVTIGWDIGITPDGPLLIEGNAWWDPVHTMEKKMDLFRNWTHSILDKSPVPVAPQGSAAGAPRGPRERLLEPSGRSVAPGGG